MAVAVAPLALAAQDGVAAFLERFARPDGGYGWEDEPDSALNPTFAVVGCYHLLKREPPRKEALINAVRNAHFPWGAYRRVTRPLHRFDFEQVQALLWLDADASDYRAAAEKWSGPSGFDKYYEQSGNPVLKEDVGALGVRALLGVSNDTPAWKQYVASRRRANGTFNTTPASDGSDGHVSNTWWGLCALKYVGLPVDRKAETAEWIRSCQLPNGGFTYAPKAEIGGVDQVYYTWAAVNALKALDAAPRDRAGCIRYLHSLHNADGGFADRPGYRSNPMATYYALEALQVMGTAPQPSRRTPKEDPAPPEGLHVLTLQFEAPGKGSPSDAVELARSLRIHLWGAKNSDDGWIECAQQVADSRKVPVTFFPANEEYGTYVSLPGLGTYSHLADVFAPPKSDFGPSMMKEKQPVPWTRFRDERIGALKRARGGDTWQFNESEEFTRVLLDEAIEKRTFEAVSSYHFGNENFLHTQPFLNPYRFLLPTIGLQDAHGQESWWWGDFLTGFRTLYLAKDRSWDGFLNALRNKWLVAVRHDKVTGNQRRFAGGSNAVRAYMLRREQEWNWMGRRPLASLQVIRPGDRFESAAPASGEMIRVRMWRDNANMALPTDAVVELVSLQVDGQAVKTEEIVKKGQKGPTDYWHQYAIPSPAKGRHTAIALVKTIATGAQSQIKTEWITG